MVAELQLIGIDSLPEHVVRGVIILGISRSLSRSEPYIFERLFEMVDPGGDSHWKGVWGCATVMTPLFRPVAAP